MLRQATLVVVLLGGRALAAPLPDDALIDAGSRKLQDGDAKGALDDFKHAAEEAFKKALALDPKLAEVRNELGTLYNDRKRWADAARELKLAVQQKPDLAEGWYNLGLALYQLKQCPDAIAAYKKVTQLSPGDADGWINLSVAARKCKLPNDAVQAARQAVKGAPGSAPAQVNPGSAVADAA